MRVAKNGTIKVPEEQFLAWGMGPGIEIQLTETPEGLLIRPVDPPLRKIYLEPTTSCNLQCRTCMRNSWDDPLGTMDMDVYRSLLAGLQDVPSLHTISFWGIGEPLLHPEILEMIRKAKDRGIRTELVTNGLLLDRNMAEGIILAGLDTIVVSVDGTTPESHAKVRTNADLGAVRENVRTLYKLRSLSRQNPEIGIEFVLTRRNLSELSGLKAFARSIGASFIFVTNVLPYTEEFRDEILYWLSAGNAFSRSRSVWYPEVMLSRLDARPEYLAALQDVLKYGESVDPVPTRYFSSDDRCPFVWEGALALSWDGNVSPCVALMHNYRCYVLGREKHIRCYTLGNVRNKEIADIWNSEEYRGFRKRVLRFDFSPCIYCGGCDFVDSNEEDCFDNPFPVCGDCLWAKGILLCP